LLASIALEEVALAHLINAEAEKVQVIGTLLGDGTVDTAQVIEFQGAVIDVLQTAIKMQMLLQFKLENVLDGCPLNNNNGGEMPE
jgi:hypothetical protein